MITFYKLLDVECGLDVYLNPKSIEYYVYKDKYVEIYIKPQKYMHVDKSDFENMLIFEGIDEYWQQLTLLTAFQLITKIKLFYYLNH